MQLNFITNRMLDYCNNSGKSMEDNFKEAKKIVIDEFSDADKAKEKFLRITSLLSKHEKNFSILKAPELLSKEEQEKRKKVQKEALNIMADNVTINANMRYICPNVGQKINKEKPNELIQRDRSFAKFLMPIDETLTLEELQEYNESLVNMTPELKMRFAADRIDQMNEFVDLISIPCSDEEFLNRIKGKSNYLNIIGELQDSNQMMKNIEEYTGLEPSKLLKDKLENLNKKSIILSALINRLSFLADPNYTFIKHPYEFSNYIESVKDAEDSLLQKYPNDKTLKNTVDEIKSIFSYQTMVERKEKYGNYFDTFSFSRADDEPYKFFDDLTRENIIALNTRLMNTNPKYYDMSGKELSFDEAYEAIKNNKTLSLYDGDKFLQTIERIDVYGYVNDKLNVEPYLINGGNKTKEFFNNFLKECKDELENGNPWYMKLRNVVSPGPYNRMIDKIDTIISKKSFKESELLDAYKYIADNAKEYLNGKENDNKERTDLTDKRIKACKAIYNKINYILDYNLDAMKSKNISKENNKIVKENKDIKISENDIKEVEFELDGLEIKETKEQKLSKLDKLFKKENPNIKEEELKEYHNLIDKDIDNYSDISKLKNLSVKRKEIKELVVSMKKDATDKYINNIFRGCGVDDKSLDKEIETLKQRIENPNAIVEPVDINNVELDNEIEEYKFTDDLDGKVKEIKVPFKEMKKDDELNIGGR